MVGWCLAGALLVVLLYVPALTMVWAGAIAVGVVCGSVIARYPIRRLAPGDLRETEITSTTAPLSRIRVEQRFAPKFVRLFPDIIIIGACAFVAASLLSMRVESILAPEEISCAAPCVLLATLCAVLAGRQMLLWKTEEFLLRARQYPAWLRMIGSRSVIIACMALPLLIFSDIPGITQPAVMPEVKPRPIRYPVSMRTISPSEKIVIEFREIAAQSHEVWVRNRQQLVLESRVAAYSAPVAALMSPDDAWLALEFKNRAGVNEVELFGKVSSVEGEPPRYGPTQTREHFLSTAFLRHYAEATGDGERLNRSQPSVSAVEWSKKGNRLTLALMLNSSVAGLRFPPWIGGYLADQDRLEGDSPAPVADQQSRDAVVETVLREVLRLQERRALANMLEYYDEAVTYYDRPSPVDRGYISREKRRLFSDWPTATCEIIGPVEISERLEDGRCKVTLSTRFSASNAATGAISEGEELITFSIRFVDDVPKITGETSMVARRGPQNAQSAAETAPERPPSFPGEVYPQTRERILTEADAAGWSIEELRYAINEMFARHGADLIKPEVNRLFEKFSWYHPRPGVSLDEIERDEFSEVERQNLRLLGALRDRKRGNR